VELPAVVVGAYEKATGQSAQVLSVAVSYSPDGTGKNLLRRRVAKWLQSLGISAHEGTAVVVGELRPLSSFPSSPREATDELIASLDRLLDKAEEITGVQTIGLGRIWEPPKTSPAMRLIDAVALCLILRWLFEKISKNSTCGQHGRRSANAQLPRILAWLESKAVNE
jgi:hypothetical protein